MNQNARLSRRLVLQAGAASTMLGAPGLLLAQPRPVKIGLIHPVSGALAYSGGQGRMGCQMAIDEINAAGGILGRPIEKLEYDDEAAPAKQPAVIKKLQGDGID